MSAAPSINVDATALAAENEAASKVILALLRLAQQSTLYADNNQAQKQALEICASAVAAYSEASGRNLTIFFSDRAVYVGRRLLRANRNTYAAAEQLRELLGRMGVSQITIAHDVPLAELRAVQAAFGKLLRSPGRVDPPEGLSRVRLRVGRPPGDYAEFDRLTPDERAVKVYALAIVIVRRFYEGMQQGSWEIGAHLRRISEELITLAGEATPALLAATVARPPHDDAERAVSAAILALAMAHELTDDPRHLRWLATAALLCEVGKPRVAGQRHDPSTARLRMPTLGLDQYRELPGATAFVTTSLGRLTDAGMMRSVLVYETLYLEHGQETGALYNGERGPAMLSRLLAASRRFQLGLSLGKAASDVMATLVKKADGMVDRWILQLMMATLAVLPTGTIVRLDDGRTARVVSPPTPRVDFGRPLVRLLEGGGYLDLNEVGEGGPAVAEIVATLDQDYVASPRSDEAPPSEDPSEWAERLSSLPPEDDGLEWSLDEEEPPVDDDVYVMVGPKDEPRSELPSIPPPPDPEPAPRPMARPPVSDRPPPSNPGLETPLVPQQGLRPAAQGTFAKSPLPHLLVYALDNALTGSMLIVDRHRQRHAIRFEAGQPSKVHTALVVAPLDRVVAEMELLPRDVLDRTLARATRDHSLHGQILVKRGLLQLDELLAVLRQQIVDRMGFLMRLGPTTRYAYYDGVDLLADMGGAITSPCDPYPLIMMGVRKYLDWDVLDKVLEKVKDRELTLHPEATPARLGLKREEREALEFFEREPMSLIELLGFGDLDEVAAQRLIYALIVTRSIDLSKGTRRPVGV